MLPSRDDLNVANGTPMLTSIDDQRSSVIPGIKGILPVLTVVSILFATLIACFCLVLNAINRKLKINNYNVIFYTLQYFVICNFTTSLPVNRFLLYKQTVSMWRNMKLIRPPIAVQQSSIEIIAIIMLCVRAHGGYSIKNSLFMCTTRMSRPSIDLYSY